MARELSRFRVVVRNYINHMAQENVQVVHLKLQMQLDVDFFKKLLKEDQAQEMFKNLSVYLFRQVRQLLHESPNLVYQNTKTASALTTSLKKNRVD